MEHKIREVKNFNPVELTIIFESVAELQEFQIRMDLYGKDLRTTRPQACTDADINFNGGHSIIKGIGNLRKDIKRILGPLSAINPL